MRVTFKASPELLKVCEIGESIGDADDSFRRQFSILVLGAVRNREIPVRNKNGFKIPPESLDITERQTRDFAERHFLERLGDFDADLQRARESAAAQPWIQQHYDIDAKLQAYANEYEKYKQHIEPQIQSETNRLLDDWYRDASVLVSEVAEWFCKAHDFEGQMAASSNPTSGAPRSVSDATPARFALRDMQDGLDQVTREKAGEPNFEARVAAVNLTDERCIELAHSHELRIAHWTALTGIGIGVHWSHVVSAEGVAFRNWTEGEISQASVDQQIDMHRDNEAIPLRFPCTPARLIQFIDAAPPGSHSFSIPDVFRKAVTDTPVPGEAPEQNDDAHSGAPEKAASVVTPAADFWADDDMTGERLPDDEEGEAATLEQEQKAPISIPKWQILSVEWPLHGPFNQKSLANALSDVPDWLKPARTGRGAPGVASALWNPATIADCLVDKGHANQKALGPFLAKHFPEWLNEWEKLQEYR